MAARWSRRHTSNAEGMGLIPGREKLGPHMPCSVAKQSDKKWAKDLNRHLTKDTQTISKYRKRHPTSHVIRETKVKTMRHTSVRTAKTLTTDTQLGPAREATLSIVAGRNAKRKILSYKAAHTLSPQFSDLPPLDLTHRS